MQVPEHRTYPVFLKNHIWPFTSQSCPQNPSPTLSYLPVFPKLWSLLSFRFTWNLCTVVSWTESLIPKHSVSNLSQMQTYYLPLLNMAFQIPYFLTNYTLKGRSHWSTFAILTTLLFCLLFISISYTWQYLAVKWTTAVFQHRSAPHIKDMHNTCIIPSMLKKEKNKRSIR